MTTNCIVPPAVSYQDRLYTTGAASYPGCVHIDKESDGNKDFSLIIEHAKKCEAPAEIETGKLSEDSRMPRSLRWLIRSWMRSKAERSENLS